jgi:hypothetical protein
VALLVVVLLPFLFMGGMMGSMMGGMMSGSGGGMPWLAAGLVLLVVVVGVVFLVVGLQRR